MEHGSDLWWRLRGGQILDRLRVLAALEVVGHVTIFPQEREELQQEVAEVLTDAEPPYRKIRAELNSATTTISFFNLPATTHAQKITSLIYRL